MDLKEPDIISLLASQAGALKFFSLLFPGFFALFVYDQRVPGERRKFGDLGIALVGYSLLIDVPALIYLQFRPISATDKIATAMFMALAGLVIPGIVGWFIVDVRANLAKRGWILAPEPKAWDFFFGNLNKTGKQLALIITLTNDNLIYAMWAEDPFASSFPAEEDLLLTVPCILNENGKFVRIAGAKAVLVRRAEIRTIEAYEPGVYLETMPAGGVVGTEDTTPDTLN
jgi:hypothetical protein